MDFKYLLKKIQRSFSDERIQRSKERLTKVWDLEFLKDRIPYVFSKIPDNSEVVDDRLYETGYDFDELLYFQCYQIKERAVLDDDYIPALFPGLRQSAIPSAFGALEDKRGEHYWSVPIIKSAEDVYKLGEPDFNKRGTAAWRILENIKFFRKKTDGLLPIHIADMQGPMACASTMWDVNDFLAAMYTNPKEVHYLLDILTTAFIKFVELQIEAAEGDIIPIHAMPFAWMPRNKGMSLSNDLLAMISPKLYEEFSLPYDNRISQHFGGLLIHSCGNFQQNLAVLKNVWHLNALNFGLGETDLMNVVEVFGRGITYVLHATDVATPGLKVLSPKEFISKSTKIIKEHNLSALVMIIVGVDYTREMVLQLNELAKKESSLN